MAQRLRNHLRSLPGSEHRAGKDRLDGLALKRMRRSPSLAQAFGAQPEARQPAIENILRIVHAAVPHEINGGHAEARFYPGQRLLTRGQSQQGRADRTWKPAEFANVRSRT